MNTIRKLNKMPVSKFRALSLPEERQTISNWICALLVMAVVELFGVGLWASTDNMGYLYGTLAVAWLASMSMGYVIYGLIQPIVNRDEGQSHDHL